MYYLKLLIIKWQYRVMLDKEIYRKTLESIVNSKEKQFIIYGQ